MTPSQASDLAMLLFQQDNIKSIRFHKDMITINHAFDLQVLPIQAKPGTDAYHRELQATVRQIMEVVK